MKSTHGGARKGAGRKPSPDRLVRIDARLSKSQIEFLKNIDPNVSKAIRTITDQQRGKMDAATLIDRLNKHEIDAWIGSDDQYLDGYAKYVGACFSQENHLTNPTESQLLELELTREQVQQICHFTDDEMTALIAHVEATFDPY